MAFLNSFIMYLGKFVFYVILAICGIFAGKKIRDSKDAKMAQENPDKKINE